MTSASKDQWFFKMTYGLLILSVSGLAAWGLNTAAATSDVTKTNATMIANIENRVTSREDKLSTVLSKIDEHMDELAVKIASIESSRFTSKDGLEIWRAIDDIRTRMAITHPK